MSLKNMPVIPLRGLTVFPNMVMSFPIGRKLSLDAVDEAQEMTSGFSLFRRQIQRSPSLI